jgi:hypothetical protein
MHQPMSRAFQFWSHATIRMARVSVNGGYIPTGFVIADIPVRHDALPHATPSVAAKVDRCR